MAGLSEFTYVPPKQFPPDFIGGRIFKEAELWKEQMAYVVRRGFPVASYVKRIINAGEVDLFDPELYDDSLPAKFNKKRYDNLRIMESKFRHGGPASNYKSYLQINGNIKESFLEEMLGKYVIKFVRDDEIQDVLFNPIGSVEQNNKLRLTFHSLLNCFFKKLKFSLTNQLVGSLDMRGFAAAEGVDLKKYYYLVGSEVSSELICVDHFESVFNLLQKTPFFLSNPIE